MADEIFNSGLGDLRLSASLHQELALLHTDRAFLMGHPAIRSYGYVNGSGSDQSEIPLAGLDGYDSMAAVAENGSVANTALTDDSPNIAVARQAIQREMTDLAHGVDSVGLTIERLARSTYMEASKRFTGIVANLVDDFTATVGATGVNMDTNDYFDATFTLELTGAEGPWLMMLFTQQWVDFKGDLRGEGGALQFSPATQDMLKMRGPGFKGSFLDVDIYASPQVPTANGGADSAGGLFSYGAIGYKEMKVRQIPGTTLVMPAGGLPVAVEFERDASGAKTKVVGNYYVGASIIHGDKGVSIITDR